MKKYAYGVCRFFVKKLFFNKSIDNHRMLLSSITKKQNSKKFYGIPKT